MTITGTRPIETERLILRRVKESDAENIYANWTSDPRVTKFLTWDPHPNVEETRRIVNKWLGQYEENAYIWGLGLKELGQLIGTISVVNKSESHKSCEIGYCMGYNWWGKDIMTESLRAVIDYLFGEGFNRVMANHDTNNPASGRVMEKSGMVKEGVLRQARFSPVRGFYDLAVYSILNLNKI